MSEKKEWRGGKREGSGRKPLDKEIATIYFRTNPEDKKKIENKAKSLGLSTNQFMQTLVDKEIKEF